MARALNQEIRLWNLGKMLWQKSQKQTEIHSMSKRSRQKRSILIKSVIWAHVFQFVDCKMLWKELWNEKKSRGSEGEIQEMRQCLDGNDQWVCGEVHEETFW